MLNKAFEYAPIVVFVYNRADKAQNCLEKLASCEEAKNSDLYVFSDAPANNNEKQNVEEVRKTIKSINKKFFKSITIRERKRNKGIYKSIVGGVSEVIKKHGKVIVLEDDISVAPYFLTFMNTALVKYEGEKKVFGVTGHSFDSAGEQNFESAYFLKLSSVWSWGTWKDRWELYENRPSDYKKLVEDGLVEKFNYDGAHDWYSLLDYQMKSSTLRKNVYHFFTKTHGVDAWDVLWYYAVFKHDGLFLFPPKALVKNIGHDGTGIHCKNVDIDDSREVVSEEIRDISFPTQIVERPEVRKKIQACIKGSSM